MFPEESLPFQNAALRTSFGAVGEMVPGCRVHKVALGDLLGPASRRHFPPNSCFATKENTFAVGFQLRRPPAMQQVLGSQR